MNTLFPTVRLNPTALAALAGAGEVLTSSTVKDLVVGSDIDFENRGSHALKGVPEEWRLFAVRN